ncbi:methionyl-tRNA formyltransferase [Pelotomaculum propionicicum]|uniref:Methionyl-tRNA formyltransferase n=1 Tax=Pelotomaculum propionicicum TaxID=258475 RepID=A0A4Y7RNJ8_9FIRM|nr:methionyl-tRNA formyltransferase [Pelotomaculum propionicicum]NLI12796.1 methionyl-tRNA formyltransferase [Peptococcaceae bacterium]TEB10574.1 Methionyl-tRNA formyltransferase [Pelotomaculum propionicicum]
MLAIFMGTPDFAVPSFKALVGAGHEVAAVVTQPDRPRGRGRKEAPPPVKEAALSFKIPVYQPSRIKDPEFIALLESLSPDVIVVAAFGRILPAEILRIPRYGCINVHASLLPKYRGAAPIHWAVINGEKETGITTMYMDEGLDTGDMILREAIPINDSDTVSMVHDRLARLGAQVLVKTLSLVGSAKAPRVRQTGSPTYAPMIKAEDEQILWDRPARDIYNQIRGMNAWPGARTTLSGRVLKVWSAEPLEDGGASGLPGQVLPGGGDGIIVKTGGGRLKITELQLQGAKKMNAADFLRGTPVPPGTILGETKTSN